MHYLPGPRGDKSTLVIQRDFSYSDKTMPTEITKEVRKFDAHVFVCTNERPAGHPRGCCKERGGEALLQALKQELASAGLNGKVRAQKAGCLDSCEFGPALVIYPEGIWYGPVKAEDAREIVRSHLVEGKPVERLKIPGK